VAASRQDLMDGLIAARSRHASRSRAARVAQAAVGLVLLVLAVPLSIVLPELGVPGLLFALRLLADEFDWAARGYATVAWQWERFRTWLATRSAPVKVLVILAMSIVVLILIAVLLSVA
jgi:hypothetical protein